MREVDFFFVFLLQIQVFWITEGLKTEYIIFTDLSAKFVGHPRITVSIGQYVRLFLKAFIQEQIDYSLEAHECLRRTLSIIIIMMHLYSAINQ